MGVRLEGFSAFGVGASWKVTEGDTAVARRVVVFLEDRRVLFGERHGGDEIYCIESAIECRAFLTEQIMQARPGKHLDASLTAMRAAFRQFVDRGGPDGVRYRHQGGGLDPFSLALGELRAQVGYQLGRVVSKYGLEIETELARIVPPVDDDSALAPFFGVDLD